MSTKIESPSIVEPRHGQSSVSVSASSTVSASSPKVSMFGTKAGFVIPKNKLSGSLVPIFRGVGKVDAGSMIKEESNKQVQRKTKWGTDLTQDAAVRKGRAVAYQTRVEQITEQLKSGSLEFEDDQDSESPNKASTAMSASNKVESKFHKVELLELERRELIGEILRLNPSYKAPPDYKPLLKESKFSIPIKTYPGYNFLGLLLGPESNMQKRLEEETGAKVRVYGTKSGLGEKCEITKSDVSEAQDGYEDLYVHVSADTYEKVDTAVALIELLLTPVSGNAGVTPNGASSSAANNANAQKENQDTSGFVMTPANNVIQVVPHPSPVPVQPGQPPFQPYSALWLSATLTNAQSQAPSTFMPPFLPNNPTRFPLLRATPSGPEYFSQPPNFGSLPRTSLPHLRAQLPTQLPTNQSPAVPSSQPLVSGLVATAMPPAPVNTLVGLPSRGLITPVISGWFPATNAPPAMPSMNQMANPAPNTTMMPHLSVPSAPTSSGPSQYNMSDNVVVRPPVANFTPNSASLFPPRSLSSPPIFSSTTQIGLRPSSGMVSSSAGSPMPPLMPSSGSFAAATAVPSPRPSSLPQMVLSAPVMASRASVIVPRLMPMPSPSSAQATTSSQSMLQLPQLLTTTPTSISPSMPSHPLPATNSLIGSAPVTTPKPLRPISGDFTFQPLRTWSPSSQNASVSNNSVVQNSKHIPFSAPKAPSFRPALQSPMPLVLAQSSPRLQHVQHQPLPSEALIPPTAPGASFPPNATNIRPPPPMLQGYANPRPVQPAAPVTPVGSQSFSTAPQAPNPSSSMPAYPSKFHPLHHSRPLTENRPGGSFTVPNQQLSGNPMGVMVGFANTTSGGNQIYDPFSPTASPTPPQGANPTKTRKPETDAEYEDLMASVGVK